MELVKKAEMYKGYLILALFLLLMACEKNGYDAPEEQPVYFEYHYVNHAWSLQDNGWLIDGDGTIRRFEFPDNYNTGVHGDFLSLEQLENNLGQADSVVGTVDCVKLKEQVELIEQASEGQITEILPRGADGGLGIYSCYKYDPEHKAYQFILLSVTGDYEQYNQSPEAEELAGWLKGIQQ